ncbi:Murein biosynthesis integral membrane protein MurJ [Candidatus Hepatincolaceae symbiont of Richtersius coronifer]
MNFLNIIKVSFFTLLSRFLGLFRDILLSRYLGAGSAADAFFVALKIPNLFRRFFAEGTMQSAFIPIFNKIFSKDAQQSKAFSSQVFTLYFIALIAFIIFVEIFAEYLVIIIAPGFKSKDLETFYLTVSLVRITLPYLFFISLSSFYSSILNSLNKFTMVAFLPAFLNITIIGFLLLGEGVISYAYWASIGVLVGGLSQLLIVVYGCYHQGWLVGFSSIKRLYLPTKEFFKKIVPVILGAGVYQINILVDIVVASLLPFGTISYLFYADRIYQLPIAIIGMAIGTVILPVLSNKANFSQEQLNRTKENALIFALGFSIPATLGLLILSNEIIKILFFGGAFGTEALRATSSILLIYALSLPANILIKVILPIYYSEGDTTTPFYSTLICLAVNLILVIILSHYFSYLGIAWATTIASYCNFFILVIILQIKFKIHFSQFFKQELRKIMQANVIMLSVLLLVKFTILTNPLISLGRLRLLIIGIILMAMLILLIMLKYLKSFIYIEAQLIFKRKKTN